MGEKGETFRGKTQCVMFGGAGVYLVLQSVRQAVSGQVRFRPGVIAGMKGNFVTVLLQSPQLDDLPGAGRMDVSNAKRDSSTEIVKDRTRGDQVADMEIVEGQGDGRGHTITSCASCSLTPNTRL